MTYKIQNYAVNVYAQRYGQNSTNKQFMLEALVRNTGGLLLIISDPRWIIKKQTKTKYWKKG